MTTENNRIPTAEARVEAERNPGGWVYEIDGRFSASSAVPPEGIIGAWKVNDAGNIIGEFIPNPNYRADDDENNARK